MFTGIIQDKGIIRTVTARDNYLAVTIESPLSKEMKDGDSIACDGVCLTVVRRTDTGFDVDVSQETLAKTTASEWKETRRINLEPALRMGDRFGGHIVTGHIDCRGKVVGREMVGESLVLDISFSDEYAPLVIPKGSIAIDGVSLTVNVCSQSLLSVNLIPFTCENTTLANLTVGDAVNLEFDMIGKYVVSAVRHKESPAITRELLQKSGW
ncbi:MAG: riboflavin synthase [Candidatus Zixiibacteriota bacterium]